MTPNWAISQAVPSSLACLSRWSLHRSWRRDFILFSIGPRSSPPPPSAPPCRFRRPLTRHGYSGGTALLLTCLAAVQGPWYWSQGTVSVNTVSTPKVEAQQLTRVGRVKPPAAGAATAIATAQASQDTTGAPMTLQAYTPPAGAVRCKMSGARPGGSVCAPNDP